MRRFAIGDIQGCYQSLQSLLEKIKFNPQQDQLWLVGDLINRGPDSLATLRYLYSIRHAIKIVLGNHDLHFIAAHYGLRKKGKLDTLDELLAAPDCQLFVDWLSQQPLVYHDKQSHIAMVHAGIPPQWSLAQALNFSAEVESALKGNQRQEFLSAMYGNTPAIWSSDLKGTDRLRVITNYFTRMRFCSAEGELELQTKEDAAGAPEGLAPWFSHTHRKTANEKIIFGHWAALQGKVTLPNLYALDTGCVWGGSLTAMDLSSYERVSYGCTR
jgi:bis(5'-nucleosyl)-tetraphosphatase (symmetrical)